MRAFFSRWLLVASILIASTTGLSTAVLADAGQNGGAGQQPQFGPNVHVFSPSTPQSEIQATVNALAAQQVSNQFGPQRYSLLFKPGTYGSPQNPLNFQLGYYTSVAGLGLSPNDVVINGSIDVYNQCSGSFCTALNNFWRSMSNLTINVTNPNGCRSREFWAVSQAAPMRRVQVNGESTLMDYCTQPSYASGGFIADTAFSKLVVNGSQQQWITRNSSLGGVWTNAVWNQVFSGVLGAPAQSFPNPTYTTLAASPVTREAPYLYLAPAGNHHVFVPSVQHDSAGPTWGSGATAGSSIPIGRFFVATPASPVEAINHALGRGTDLLP